MKLLLALFMAIAIPSLWAQDQRPKHTIPAKGYHVILYSKDQRFPAARVIGRIPETEKMEIQATADAVTSGISVTLTGNVTVTVSIDGKPTATYQGDELVLTPVATASEPLTHQDVLAKLKEFDAAVTKRDSKSVTGFFAENAKISTESLTTAGVQSRAFSREEYAEHLKNIFPAALRIEAQDYFNESSPGNDDERPGYQMQISKDGITATGRHNVRYVITLAEGQIYWRINRKLSVEKRGTAFVITSMDVTLPKSLKENWPEPKQNQFGRPRGLLPLPPTPAPERPAPPAPPRL